MKGVCFEQVGRIAVGDFSDPVVKQSHDAIVRVDVAGLCGSDLHPFFGREVGLDPGTVMGHEFVGEVIAVGDQVQLIQVGDRVCAPFTTNCGHCFYCNRGLTSRCTQGELFGWRENGSGLHGGQASQIRVPLADGTLMKVPAGINDDVALLLGDNLCTGYFAADMLSISPGDVHCVVGCGTVGLLAIVSALQLGATKVIAIDPNEARLGIARSLGATTFTDAKSALDHVHELTEGRGADGVMEIVGLPEAQSLAYRLLRPGGVMSVIGCHCTPNFAFTPSAAYDKNLTYRTGRCPARHYMPLIAKQLADNPIDLSWCMTHRFTIDEAEKAYDVFANRKDNCVKAVIDF